MIGSLAEALIVMVAAAASCFVFAVIGRRTLTPIPHGGGAPDAPRR